MNGLDYAIAAIIAIGATWGLAHGALRMLTSAVSLLASLYLASVYYQEIGGLLERGLGVNPAVAAITGYLALFAIVFFAVELVGRGLTSLLHIVHLGWADRLAGAALGAALAVILTGLAIMPLAALLPSDSQLMRESQLAPQVLVYNRALLGYVPDELKAQYEAKRTALIRYWAESEARLAAKSIASPDGSPSPTGSR